jgi:hypothetical protein
MLRVFVADLQTWHAHPCLDHQPSQATQRPPRDLAAEREIRSRATQMALFAIALVARSTWAADESQLFYAHVASFRPWRVNQDWVADSLVPAICRVFFRSRPLQVALPLLWVVGIACGFSVLFDRFEAGSVQEGIACFAVTLTFPSIVCIVASLNAKTVRRLLKEFETLYVLAFVLGMVCMQLALFRDHPAKLGCVVLALPSLLMSGFMDAYIEGGRVLTSRVFFCLNLAGLLLYLALFVLNLGVFAELSVHVLSFVFDASSLVCSSIVTLVVFGAKNIVMSFARRGSLVTLVSSVCCILLDADAFALLEVGYSVLGVAYGKRKANATVARELRKRAASIAAQSWTQRGHVAIAPAPADEVSTQPQLPSLHPLDGELHCDFGDGAVDRDRRDAAGASGRLGGNLASVRAGCPPFNLDA